MSKRKEFSDQLDWFYTHCSTHHEELRTKKGMIDIAKWAMRQVKCHFVNVKPTDGMKSVFARMLCETQKCTGTMPIFHCYKYTSPISNKLVELQDDPGFTERRNCTVVIPLLNVPCMGGGIGIGQRRRSSFPTQHHH